MNTQKFANTAKSINLRKLAKPMVLFMCALFIVGIVSTFASTPVKAATTTLSLHTSGNQILDSNNNPVTIRGVGIAGMAPDLILWGKGTTDGWGSQWASASGTAVTDTFQEMSQNWHINMIRVFVYPEWYWLNSAPGSNGNTQTYIQTLVSQAAQYGIYVDIVPYQLTACANSFSGDPYLTPNQGGGQGLPMSGFDSAGQAFIASTGLSEQQFWTQYWTLMANNLKGYSNVIFEAWNEPAATGNWGEPVTSGYKTYLQTMYNSIRATGATNLIFMQWEMGWAPGDSLSWASTINTALGGNPVNVAYTTHFYYHAPSDLSSYWGSLTQSNIEGQLQNAISQMGVTAPLVANEEGSCLGVAGNVQNDYTWWSLMVQAQAKLGIGYGPYYWLSDSGLGGAYIGETLISSGYTPNTMGQAYINSYTGTPSPSPSPTPTISPTPTPTTTPRPTTTPTPTTSLTPTPTATPRPTTTPTPTPTPTSTPTPTPIPTPTSTNIITNGGFESGVSPWQVITSGSTYTGSVTQSTDAHTAVNSGLFTVSAYPGTGGYVALSQAVTAQVGKSYTLTFWYKNAMGFAMPHVFCKDSSGNDITYFSGSALSSTTSWTSATMTFGPIPTGTVRTELHFDVGSTGTIQLDDLSTGNGNPSPTPTPTATPTPTPSPTPKPAPTATPTPTPTQSPTASPTPTAKPSPTPTQSPSPTPTPHPSRHHHHYQFQLFTSLMPILVFVQNLAFHPFLR